MKDRESSTWMRWSDMHWGPLVFNVSAIGLNTPSKAVTLFQHLLSSPPTVAARQTPKIALRVEKLRVPKT